jgi:hypothetical protein
MFKHFYKFFDGIFDLVVEGEAGIAVSLYVHDGKVVRANHGCDREAELVLAVRQDR